MPIINTLEIYEDLKSQFKEEEARTLTKALENYHRRLLDYPSG